MKVVILIPTYNERENIDKLLTEILLQTKKLKADTFKILIVDDKSPDGTGDIVRTFMKKNKNIFLLEGKKNGLGKAMVRGYGFVLKNLKCDVVVTNEADFGFDFKLMPKMIKKIKEGYDVVVASRHVGNGHTTGWTFERKLNHFIANTLFAGIVAGIDEVNDKNGAMRAIRVKGVLDKLKFSKFPTKGFCFFFYQIFALSRITDKFYEIPAIFKFRTRGESKVSFNPKYLKIYIKDIVEYILLAFKIRLERLELI